MQGIGGKIKENVEDFIVEEIPIEKKNSKEHVQFWLEKRNWDTHLAIRMLAKKLHVSKKRFGFAGTKDKRALTRQRVSIWDPDRKIEEKLKKLKIKDLRIYGIERGDRINLGDLEGNKFLVTIRDIDLSEKEIKERLEKIFSVLRKGIPNFFGPQRFGEVRPISHLVGLEMLKGNFEEAVKIYLAKPFPKEGEEVKKAREWLLANWGKRKAYLKALELFPKYLRYDRNMLDYLYKHPKDFVGTLRRIPKRVRKLFLNAVQAWIFNEVLKGLLEEKTIEELKDIKIPLVGYDTKLTKGEIGEKIKKIMEKLDIKKEDFIMRSMPEMRCEGSERNAILQVKDIKLIKIGEDEYNKGKKFVQISFSLPKGAYATVVLEKIIGSKSECYHKN
jgi:tRNA pseudouridine13 synthase